MRLLFEIFAQTLRTLWAHKLRSFLTMFGIAWGVGSLLLLVGLGEGFRSGNRKQFDDLGENVMFIWGGRAPAMNGSFTGLRQYYLTYRSEEHTSELQSRLHLVCRLLLEKKKKQIYRCCITSYEYLRQNAVAKYIR